MKTSQKTNTPQETCERLSALGAHLRARRVASRMTHADVASVAGFSRQTLSRIEKGDPSVSIGQVARYASLVGASAFAIPESDVPLVAKQRVRRKQSETTTHP